MIWAIYRSRSRASLSYAGVSARISTQPSGAPVRTHARMPLYGMRACVHARMHAYRMVMYALNGMQTLNPKRHACVPFACTHAFKGYACVRAVCMHAHAIRSRARLCFVPLSLHQHRGVRACYAARTIRNRARLSAHACRTHARTRTVIPHSDVCAGGARVIYRGRNGARLSYARMHACPHRRLQPHSTNVLFARYCPNRARHRPRRRWQP
jgi:hypothetical protein